MKNTTKIAALILAIIMMLSLTACKDEETLTGIWEDATYTEDVTLGNGGTTITVDCVAEDKTVTITIKTDKATLGEALVEHNLVDNGTFFSTFNGMTADYNANQSWWKVCQDGEMTSVGIAELVLSDGNTYEIIYTIGW